MWLAGALVLVPVQPAAAGESVLGRAIPADAWAAIVVTPEHPGQEADRASPSGGTLETAAFLFDQARRMGLLAGADRTTTAVIDAVGSLPLIGRYPYALCLLSGSAEALPSSGYRLAELRAGLIVHTCGDNAALEARLRHLLNTYANSEVASVEPRQRGADLAYRLTDRRLPGWARIEWGQVGDCYVVALGPASFDTIADTLRGEHPSLVQDAWVRPAHDRCQGDDASVEWTVRFDEIRRGLQPIMSGQPDEVLGGLGLAEVDRGLWTVGFSGRAVQAYAVLRRGGRDDFAVICRPEADPDALKMIPPQATQYAIIDRQPADLVRLAREAYLASRSPSTRERLRQVWSRVEADTGLRLEGDLLSQLGAPVVIHNCPQHALNIPLARTIVVPIAGSPAAVRRSVDRLLGCLRERLAEPDSGWPLLQLRRADDGVWYLQAGLCGPAVAVTDHYLVISYSPAAVRQNLPCLEANTPQAPNVPGGGQGNP